MRNHRIGLKTSPAADRQLPLASYLLAEHEKPMLRFTTAGSVDDGKSTLIGRLLHDAHSVYDDHMEALQRSGVNRSAGPLDFSLLTDGLKAEREQGITIDVAYRHFATSRRRFLIADTPGHEQYTRNMATGASTADAAIILVDARHGLTAQSRRHAYIAWQLGIRHLLFAVNKMDLLGFDRVVFERVRAALDELAGKLPGAAFHVVPVSALEGDNVATRSARMPWYRGPSLMDLLETIDAPAWNAVSPMRFMVQYVIRPDLDFRGYAGRIESGRIRAGEHVTVLPTGTRSRVKRIVTFDGDLDEAVAPMAVTLVLEDELDISRGDWICGKKNHPMVGSQFEATLVWMHERPLVPGARVLLQQGAMRVPAQVREIVHRVDPETYEAEPASQLALNEIGLVRVETARALVFDEYRENRQTGAFILIDRIDNFTLGAGMVTQTMQSEPELRRETDHEFGTAPVTPAERLRRYGHASGVVLSRSKPLLAALERALFARGAVVAVLETLPPKALLQELLMNGLILLAPSSTVNEPEVSDWIEAVQTASINESVQLTLRELERVGLLLPRKSVLAGGGYLNVD
jgi:sulfate adenylyltransferase large subunit